MPDRRARSTVAIVALTVTAIAAALSVMPIAETTSVIAVIVVAVLLGIGGVVTVRNRSSTVPERRVPLLVVVGAVVLAILARPIAEWLPAPLTEVTVPLFVLATLSVVVASQVYGVTREPTL